MDQNGVCRLLTSYPNCKSNLILKDNGTYTCTCDTTHIFYENKCNLKQISNCDTYNESSSTSS